ncbi:MAG: Wzy polymerase domain-containing protein [Pseudotabrizicola sp.]|uniref:PglL family O-oligosaccharyltransferase n=1 Tax=Pseudotabrizicola sp. TaxID=2939647 RepID=UPI00271C07EE|nr:Wzy polymerase domain-containing protein [Pseudotabrizicola sp.]MDO9638520.1 Wzy polymerase domain-containing protein [Pseudotabrizicola sp.]
MTQFGPEKKDAPMGRFSLFNLLPSITLVFFLAGWLNTTHVAPWVSWHAEVPFFFVILSMGWIGVVRLSRQASTSRLPIPALIWPFVGLLFIALIQYAVGTLFFLGDFFVFVFYLALCSISILLGFALTGPEFEPNSSKPWLSYAEWLAVSVLFGGLASTLVALGQVLEVWQSSSWVLPIPDTRRPGGNLGQPNHLATLIVMAIASAMFLQAVKRLGNTVTMLLMILLAGCLAVTESRTGALSLFSLMGWWWWKQSEVAQRVSRLWAAAVAAIFVAMFLLWPSALGYIRFEAGTLTARLGSGGSREGRMDVWPQLIEAALQRPWWGWGARQTSEAHNGVAHLYPYSMPFSYGHNLWLDLVIWFGFPIAGLLTVASAIWLWRRTGATQSPVSWYGFAIAVPLFVHSMFEFPHAYAYLLVPAMLGLGAVEKELGGGRLFQLGVKPAVGALLVTSILTAWSVVEYFQIEEDFRVARFELLRIGHTPTEYTQPEVHLLTQLGALTSAARIDPKPDMAPEHMLILKKVALHYPWTGTQYRYAMALALNGNSDEANRQLQVIRSQYGEETYVRLLAEIQKKQLLLNTNESSVLRHLP